MKNILRKILIVLFIIIAITITAWCIHGVITDKSQPPQYYHN